MLHRSPAAGRRRRTRRHHAGRSRSPAWRAPPRSASGRAGRSHQPSTRVAPGRLRPHLVQADDYAARRCRRVELLDRPLLRAKSGATRSPNQVSSCRRLRPSRTRTSPIRLRRMAMPRSPRWATSRSSVQDANGRPRSAGRAGQRRVDHGAPRLGGVGRRPPGAHVLLQPWQPARVEALEPVPHRGPARAHPDADLGSLQALQRVQDDPGPSHAARAQRARSRHPTKLLPPLIARSAWAKGHGRRLPGSVPPPDNPPHRKPQPACRMHQ